MVYMPVLILFGLATYIAGAYHVKYDSFSIYKIYLFGSRIECIHAQTVTYYSMADQKEAWDFLTVKNVLRKCGRMITLSIITG